MNSTNFLSAGKDTEEILMAYTLAFVIIKSFDKFLQCEEDLTCSDVVNRLHQNVDATQMMACFGWQFYIDPNILGHSLI